MPTTGELDVTVDELAARAGVPVRTIRFYTGRKLLPPPRLEGRTGRYGAVHLARLRLIRDLQDAGYTLAAIEQFLAALPDDADADTVDLFGTVLTPWVPQDPLLLTRGELAERVGREVDDDLLAALDRANLLDVRADGRIAVDAAQLDFALRLLDLEAPIDALIEAGEIVRRHAAALAGELQALFRERIVARFADATPEDRARLRAIAAGLRPLTIQSIITAYHQALDREVRGEAGHDPHPRP